MRCVISGYYGFSNAGDEAVLAAIVQGLARHFPDCRPCVLSADPAATRREHGVEAVQRWCMGDVWRELAAADLLLQGGGSLIQDATSAKSALYYLAVLRMARMRRVPAMVFAQGFGPLRNPGLRLLARWEYEALAAITARDEETIQELRRLGVQRVEPVLTADPALLLQPDMQAATAALEDAKVDGGSGLLLLSLRDWAGVDRLMPMLASITESARSRYGLRAIAVPFQEPEDVAIAEALCRADRHTRLVRCSDGPAQLMGVVAQSRAVVSMRLHGIIFAAAQAVPAVGISYDPKLNAFGGRARQPVVKLGGCTQERLTALVDGILAEAGVGSEKRRATAAELQAAAEQNFDVLGGLLTGQG